MKKLLQLCLVAALAAGAQAHAALIDQSTTQDVSSTLNAGGSFAFNRTLTTDSKFLGEGKNYFSDHYTFTLDSASQAAALMNSVLYPNGSGLVITGFNLRLNDVEHTFVSSGELLDPADQTWFLTREEPLSSGSYFLEVNGYATATSASYSGTLAVAAVPEPSSLALMLAGVGILGVTLRRRRA
jgi:hypothetical protein